MHAVQIRAAMCGPEDTDVDAPKPLPRGRTVLLMPRRPPPPPAPERAVTEAPTAVRTRAPRPRGQTRLVDLQVQESKQRRVARRLSTIVTNPAVERGEAMSIVRVAWHRSEDAGLGLCGYGRDGVLITGRMTGMMVPGARRAVRVGGPTGPSVAVGIDGLMYTIFPERGDSAALVAQKLAARLRARFEVEVEHRGVEGTLVRVRSERLGRR
jgi:hypothetical protein